MKLFIDARETNIMPYIKIPFETESLLCGDFLFEEDNFRLLIERKTIQDLHSSIIDGRYREQRSRLLEWRNDNHKIIYVIEGLDSETKLETMLHRLMIGYSVPVHRTNNIEKTADWIEWIYTNKSLSVFFQTRDLMQDRIENIRFSKNMKKENVMNQKTILISLLYSINGISYPMAVSIAEPFKSVEDFIQNRALLESTIFMYETLTKNKKKIGSKIIQKIVNFVFN